MPWSFSLKSLCGGGVASSHPSVAAAPLFSFFLPRAARDAFFARELTEDGLMEKLHDPACKACAVCSREPRSCPSSTTARFLESLLDIFENQQEITELAFFGRCRNPVYKHGTRP